MFLQNTVFNVIVEYFEKFKTENEKMKTKLKVEAISKSWLARFKMVILLW